MSVTRRLRLDDIVASIPELGPTIPDGGYSWIVLCGVLLVQMTIPSILSMYGVILGYINESKDSDVDIWSEKIILAPIIFTAFWNLADPWTKMIVNMASTPRLVGIIGVILLAVGIIATGYLATGGVGAYLASSSAGAVMGIGASFVVLLSDYVLRKNFRKKLLLALTLRNIATSVGLILIPNITGLLLHKTDLKTGLLLMTLILVPAVLGTSTFRLPSPQRTLPYSLLLTEEDNELPIRISPDVPGSTQHAGGQHESENLEYDDAEERTQEGGLFSEGSNMYAYEELDEDVDLFENPAVHSDSPWKQQIRPLKNFRFWAAMMGSVGVKTSILFFWILLPVLSFGVTRSYSMYIPLCTMAGFGTLLPNLASYKVLKMTNHNRRIYFGLAAWLCAITLTGLTYVGNYTGIMILALLGGVSIGSLSSCQDLALYDVLGSQMMRSVNKGFSTIVGLSILIFSFIHDVNFCLNITSLLLYFGGVYWLSSPVLSFLKTRQYRSSHTSNRTSGDTT
ncbi:PREDICTED: uncharacterized protein LOC107191155 [Dufourea novaeangliae]|uniref:Uncharacterized protein n=1 Tax=Dufourea novaeangliae TaxID=178035 RepID=A0A154PMJ8_DUFNO|nr:PREDICTED: uncharacterized protein LOC107191155 [Dufourea novaeangliae]KZC13105.1 hypothetical protein WN55_05510 [Dufourea novaeangliae]